MLVSCVWVWRELHLVFPDRQEWKGELDARSAIAACACY